MIKENVIYKTDKLPIFFFTSDLSYSNIRHFHKEIEIIVVRQGRIKCEIGSEVLSVSAGKVLVVNSFCPHLILPDGDNPIITYVQIDLTKHINFLYPQKNDYLTAFMGQHNSKQYEIFSEASYPHRFTDLCVESFEKQAPLYEAELTAYLFLLISEFHKAKIIDVDPPKASSSNINEIMPVIEYVETHLDEQISLGDISAVMFMTNTSLCKKFKRITGKTVYSYINFRRIELAKALLISSDLNLSAVAQKCGFKSVDYLNRIFKSLEKCTATQYRKMYSEPY